MGTVQESMTTDQPMTSRNRCSSATSAKITAAIVANIFSVIAQPPSLGIHNAEMCRSGCFQYHIGPDAGRFGLLDAVGARQTSHSGGIKDASFDIDGGRGVRCALVVAGRTACEAQQFQPLHQRRVCDR